MKKLSNQEMKKIAKSTLALVLAGTFTFSPVAMAEENSSDYETVQLEQLTPEDIEEAKTQVDELKETNPSLIPGDFFYFAKIALEKIKLAFTFDNAEEAELLAEYAAERLAEASELFSAGEEEKALEVIESAVEYMENSQHIVDEETSNGEDPDNGDSAGEGTDSDKEEATEETEVPADDVTAEEPGDDVTEDDSVKEEEVEAENPYEEIEGLMRQNIIALKAAMEHVGNDNAREALQRNIDKTYAKMAKKLAKLEEKYAEQTEDEQDTTEQETTEPVASDLQPADPTEEPAEVPVDEPADETMPADDDTAVVPVVAPVKTVKDQAKHQKKSEKTVMKDERKAAKQAVKQEKKEAKAQAKQERAEKKQSHKQQKGHEGKGNGKGNGKSKN